MTGTEVVERLVEAMNAHDLDALTGLLDEDYRSEQPAHPGRAFVGRERMRANWEAMFAGVPDLRAEVRSATSEGSTTWCEWQWSGTRSDGAHFLVRGVARFEVGAGRIRAGRLYMEDVATGAGDVVDAVQDLSGRRPDA